MNLQQKADALNMWISDVSNWVINIDQKRYTTWKSDEVRALSLNNFKHENLVVSGEVVMYGFGRIYKDLMLTSDKYHLSEIPKERWNEVLTAFFKPPGSEDAANPEVLESGPNHIIFRAKYWPPDDYVKQLVEKRNFMTTREFDIWAKVIDDKHKEVGGKTPNYIIHKPFIQVPGANC